MARKPAFSPNVCPLYLCSLFIVPFLAPAQPTTGVLCVRLPFGIPAAVSSLPHHRDIKRPDSREPTAAAARRNGKNGFRKHWFFPRREPSVFAVGSGHGPLRKRPWAKARLKRLTRSLP